METGHSDSRRSFLGWMIGGMSAAIGLVYSVPLLTYLVKPSLAKNEEPFSEVGSIDALMPMTPESFTFQSVAKVGFEETKVERDVWIVKYDDGTINVFSPVCPHLGCGYHWDADKKLFVCPCHLSMFDIHGKVVGGPAPRSLDSLQYKLEGGRLYARFEKFRLGVAEKLEA